MPPRLSSDLLAITDGTAVDLFVPRATMIARQLNARLTILLAAAVPDPEDYAPHAGREAIATIADGIEAAASRTLTRIDTLVAPQGVDTRLMAAGTGGLVRSVAHAARHADLALFPPDAACGNRVLRDRLMRAVLDGAACPTLVVRDRDPRLPAERVVLAWNGSRIASRAWRDAVRLVSPGAHVDLAIGAITAASRIDGVELAHLAYRHVRSQGFDVELHRVPIHPAGEEWRPPAERLLELERAVDAGLLVMGAGVGDGPDAAGFSELTAAMIRSGSADLLMSR